VLPDFPVFEGDEYRNPLLRKKEDYLLETGVLPDFPVFEGG
jgi:hypothetical protein